ncbi:MAG: hypothetical protein QNK04_10350 [Myxococcota bacterium]|nr:hypothetical protein [Myxococcota bacterium]
MVRRDLLAALLVAVTAVGCNPFSDAKIRKMVPGDSVASGSFECWLSLEFLDYPTNADPRDVRVRFESVALEEPAEFDWSFIAAHDVVPRGTGFGSGHAPLEASSADTDPPLGQELKVKFPLRARERIDDPPRRLYLRASLYWGGKKQASMKRTIEHVYEAESGFRL